MAKKKQQQEKPSARREQIPVELLRIDADTQARVCLCEATCEEYEQAYRNGEELPALSAVFTGDSYIVWDGFHRREGASLAGVKHLPCDVTDGTAEDARWLACGANARHGLKRTNEDKRRAVQMALAMHPEMSDRAIAAHCGVTHPFVASVRSAGGNAYHVDARVGLDGKSYPANPPATATTDDFDAIWDQPAGYPTAPADDATWDELAGIPTEAPDDGQHPTDLTPQEQQEAGERLIQMAQVGTLPQTIVLIPPPQLDAWGIPIQPHAQEAFAAIEKFKELLKTIQRAARLFNELAGLPGGDFLKLPSVSSYRRGKKSEDGEYADRFVSPGLEQAYRQIKNAIPQHTVCPYHYVDAPHPEQCRTCLNLNWTPALDDSIPTVCADRARAAHGVKVEGERHV